MIYRIYQIKDVAKCNYAFRGWDFAEKEFTINDYKWQYDGVDERKITDLYCLEELFYKFNLDRPDDFYGHSLSVSDVVALRDSLEDTWRWYYCDSFGWRCINNGIYRLSQKGR